MLRQRSSGLMLVLAAVVATPSNAVADNRSLDGFYAGGDIAYGQTLYKGFNIDDDPRDTYTQNFGSHNKVRAGGFIGYGLSAGRFYIAPELKLGTDSDATLEVQINPKAFSTLEQHYTYGAGLRLGYFLRPGILLYGRADFLRSEFEFNFNNARDATDDVHDKRTLSGWDAGGGAEIAVGSGFSVRGEYLWTEFQDFNRPTYGFDPSSGLTKVGVAYHFGGAKTVDEDRPVDFSGAYAGVHAGYGDAAAREIQDGDVANDSFYFSRSASGAAGGIFAGYGIMAGSFYLAGEGEADWLDLEMSEDVQDGTHNGWQINHSYGASVLPGYRIANAALLYGRLGFVRSEVEYETNVADADGASETLTGFRLGGGLQIAVTDHVLLRADYSHTRYDTMKYTDSDGSPDELKPEENLFRVGAGYRF